MSVQNPNEIGIYVACLAAYNNGILHGAWIDATQGVEGINEDVQAMLEASPIDDAEEWAIHDYEGFHSYRLEEYSSFKKVGEVAEFLMEHGALGAEVLSLFNNDIAEAETAMRDSYAGCFEGLDDYAMKIYGDLEDYIPTALRGYIDYAGKARDMEMNGDIYTIETGHDEVHVFYNR